MPKRIAIDALDEIVQRNRKTPPPIGMLVDCAGNVRLIPQPDQIIDRDRENARRRAREKFETRMRLIA